MRAVVAASLGLVAYTYVGYPLLVGLCARVAPGAVREDPTWLPKVTACIPVFDAASYLRAKVESLQALDWPRDALEILLYDDGSTDDTAAIAREIAAADPRVRLVGDGVRRGKPYAVNRMRELATGEVLLMTDVRQPLAPAALRALVRVLADPTVACATGNLVLRGEAGAGAYWRYESWIRRQEGRFRGVVGVTGPIYAIRRADMAELPEDVILDDLWVPMRLCLGGRAVRFAEEAEAYDDAFGDEREYGRKVRTLAGNYQLFAMLPELLSPASNPAWFETASHKLARLACPWALAALAASSVAALADRRASLASRAALAGLVAGQAAFYGLAAAGERAGRPGRLARTFVVLNSAAVVGLARHLRGAQRVTW